MGTAFSEVGKSLDKTQFNAANVAALSLYDVTSPTSSARVLNASRESHSAIITEQHATARTSEEKISRHEQTGLVHLAGLALTSTGKGLWEPMSGAIQISEQVANAATERTPGLHKTFFHPEQFSPDSSPSAPKYSSDWFVANIFENVGKLPWYLLAARAASRVPCLKEEAGILSERRLLGMNMKTSAASGFIIGGLSPTDVRTEGGLSASIKERTLQAAIGAGQMGLVTLGSTVAGKVALTSGKLLANGGENASTIEQTLASNTHLAVRTAGKRAVSATFNFAKKGSIASIGAIPAGLAAGYANAAAHGTEKEFDPSENIVATMTLGFGLGGFGEARSAESIARPDASGTQSPLDIKGRDGVKRGADAVDEIYTKSLVSGEAQLKSASDNRSFPIAEGAKPFIPEIVNKYKIKSLDEGQLHAIVESFDRRDQPLAVKILQHGLPNSSEVLFDAQMKLLRGNLETALAADGAAKHQFISVGQSGWGKAFGYLYRKLSRTNISASSVDPIKLKNDTTVGILLDDPARTKFTDAQLSAMRRLDKLYVLGGGGFETGLNFFDYAQGPETVANKLRTLLTAVKQARASQPKSSDEQLIDGVVRGDTTNRIAALSGNASLVAVQDLVPLGTAASDIAPAVSEIASILNSEKATPARIEDFLSHYVPGNQPAVAYTLAEGGKNVTYRDMFAHLNTMHAKTLQAAAEQGLAPEQLLFEDPNVNDSVDLINYMYRTATGLPAEQFVGEAQLSQMAASGALANHGIVFLDEQVLTGDKIGKRFGRVHDSADRSAAVYFSTMLQDCGPLFGEKGPPGVPWGMVAAEHLGRFNPTTWDGASDADLSRARDYSRDSGFITGQFGDPRIDFMYPTTTSNATVIWPFGLPDNDVSVMRRFGHIVFGLRQVRDPETRPLETKFREHLPTTSPPDASQADLFKNGQLELDPNQFYRGSGGRATISDGQAQVEVYLNPDNLFDHNDLKFHNAIARLNQLLNLTPRYPSMDVRKVSLESRMSNFLVSEIPSGETIAEGLTRLSDGDENLPILQTDPEIRQMTERALIEKMILAPGSENPPRLLTVSGSALTHSDHVRQRDASWQAKPTWKGTGYGLSTHYAGKEISDDTFTRLRTGLERLAADGDLKKQPFVAGVQQRLEWFLEHQRIPDTRENEDVIH